MSADFPGLLAHLDALVGEFEAHPDPAVRERALDLMRHVDAVHRPGLARLVELAGRRDPGLLEEARRDPVVAILLALYDLDGDPGPGPAFIPLERLAGSAAAVRARLAAEP